MTSTLHDHWHKIVALILNKQGIKEVRITSADIEKLERDYPHGMPTVVAQEIGGVISVRIMSEAEGRELMNREQRRN